MRIELHAIQYSAAASQETVFYSADLYLDGRKIGMVSNGGTGGADVFHGDCEAYGSADAWCRANLPPWRTVDGHVFEADLELHCADLLRRSIDADELTRALRERVLWREPADRLIYETRRRGRLDRTIDAVRHRRPEATILNELPFGMALAIWRQVPPGADGEDGS